MGLSLSALPLSICSLACLPCNSHEGLTKFARDGTPRTSAPDAASMSQDAALGSLVDELLTCIATFFPDAASLLAFERVSSRFASVAHEAAWRSLCKKRWEDKPRYRLTAKREVELSTHMRTLSWRRRYATFELDGRRSSITDEELCSLGW